MKKKNYKKIILETSVLILTLICFGIINKSNAADVVETWDVSANDGKSHVIATLYGDGKLVLSGTGNMRDYDYDDKLHYLEKKDKLKIIEIKNGITSIGRYAFYGCDGFTGNLIIPDSVTEIGACAFEKCGSLTEIDIPNSLTNIGYYTFASCRSLTKITIPNGITRIGACSFIGCSSLTKITIPSSVTNIDSQAFRSCCNLENIIVDSSNTTYDSRDNCDAIIETSTNTLIKGCNNTVIVDSITSIGDYAFSECTDLLKITIPKNITSIGEYAFSQCFSLMEIIIPDSVMIIGDRAFNRCSSLTICTDSEYIINYAKENNIKYVKVKKYKVIQDGLMSYIEKIIPNTSIETLKRNLETYGTIEVYKGNEKITDDSKLICTGMDIIIKIDNEEVIYTAVVTGDLTGNGEMGISDLLKSSRYAAGIDKTLSGAYLMASDVVKDGKYGRISDISKMSRVLAGMDNL